MSLLFPQKTKMIKVIIPLHSYFCILHSYLFTLRSSYNKKGSPAGEPFLLSWFCFLVQNSELVVAAEDVDNLVLVHFLHEVACGTAVLAGVELSGLLGQSLADSGSEGQT